MLFGKHINKLYLRYCWLYIIGVVALVAVDYAQLFLPEYLGQVVDLFEGNSIAGHENEITRIIISVLIVAAVMMVGRFIFRMTIMNASDRIQAKIREEMYEKALRLSASYFQTNTIGNVLSWFTSDVETVGEITSWGAVQLVDATFLSVLALFKMFRLSWFLSLICLIPIFLIIIWGALAEKFMTKIWDERQKSTDELYTFSQENFTGIRVIKAFVKENQQLHAFAKVARRNYDKNYYFVKISTLFDVSIEIIIALIVATILGFGGMIAYSYLSGNPVVIFNQTITLKAGELVTFSGFFATLIWPLIALGSLFSMMSRGKASLRRISLYLDSPEDIKDEVTSFELDNVKGNIDIKNLTFTYPNQKEPMLKNINVSIKQGETIGIVGKIGSGKSTLVNLLLRLYNVDKDSILIDGNDIMDIKLASLRKAIAYVPQDNFLFSDTIKNNIGLSKEEIDMDEVKNAADFASISENIEEFRDKYETVSGEFGVTLSGGQKQRIALARAYFKDAPIMILDDSVSAVDIKTEEDILKHIKEERKDKTTIIIASRISTVMHLDKILVINNGEIEGFASHTELLKISKTYEKMAFLQTLEKEINEEETK